MMEKDILKGFFLEAIPRAWVSPQNAEMVMVLGSGKCGTTTMAHLLNCSNDLLGYHEFGPRLWHLGDRVFADNCQNRWWDEIYWAARRDIISIANENGMLFAENNHRASVFAPAVKRLMPMARFIVLWRDFDETVASGCRWGWYSAMDRAGEGRIRPPDKQFDDRRNVVAWYWVTFYRWVLNFIKDVSDPILVPFQDIKEHNVESLQRIFEKLHVNVPKKGKIEAVLNQKYNSAVNNQEVPKVWHDFDREAKDITSELVRVARP